MKNMMIHTESKHITTVLRYAALVVMMMCMGVNGAWGQLPFTLTTADDITNGTQKYYLIQAIDRPTFYAIPHSNSDGAKVSTTSIPNANMRWCFVDAGSDSDHQYYYIVNFTGRCLYRNNDSNDGILIKKTYAELSSLSDDELNKYKFFLTQTGSNYFIQPKGFSGQYLNKRGGQVNYANNYYIKSSTYNDSPSVWNFVAVGSVTWPQPFTVSTNAEKHYYKFQNVTNTSFYLSNSGEWATVSSDGNDEDIWYFLEADVDATYSNCHYYYIVNAATSKYLYYTGGTGDNVAKVMDYNSEEDDKYRFLIVDGAYKPDNTNYSTCYTIVPKLRQTYFSGKDSYAPMAMSDDSHLLLKSDRSVSGYDTHWLFVETDYVAVEAPTITNNFNGTISLSTATAGATIYYTTNGDTPDNTSTAYSSAFSLGNATVIKAIAYLGSESSDVTTYNVPQYEAPTISFNSSTSQVTIASSGTVYYNTGDGSQADPTTSSTAYSAPFTVASATTIKAIATQAGYIPSTVTTLAIAQVATPTIQNNGSNTVSITCATEGATIYYTTDGGTPNTSSTQYNSPFTVSSGTTIKAIAVKADMINSDVGSGTVTLSCAVPTITFDSGTQEVTISGQTGVTIYYTTDGSTPAANNYTGTGTTTVTISNISSATTVKAIATQAGYSPSTVATLAIAQVAMPTIQNNGSNAISITCATEGATIYYTTDGSTPTTSSTEYTGPLTENVSGVTIKAIAVKENMLNSAVGSGSVTLQCAAPVIVRNNNTSITITCDYPSSGVTIYYTTDGSTTPTTSTPTYISSGGSVSVDLSSSVTVKAIAAATNYNNSQVTTTTVTAGLNGSGTEADPYIIEYQSDVAEFISTANTVDGASSYYQVISTTPLDFSSAAAITQPFSGTFDGGMQTITDLSHALFNTISGGTVKNVILEDVNISGSENVGAIANVMEGTSNHIASIYNCGILSGSVGTSGNVGSIVGLLGSTTDNDKCYARVINCYSFATVSGGANTGGIVGNNTYASKSSDIEGGSIRTMVMNCMFYGTGSNIYPIYGGQKISNEAADGRLNNYNYFSYEKLPSANITAYNNALAAEDRYLKRFEFYRYLLNSTRELAAWYATGSTANAHTKMAKWVLDKEIAEYPILKVQDSNETGTYPSVVNYDPDYTFDEGTKVARTSITERNKGKNLGELTVNISVGSGYPTGAAIKPGKSQITLQRTDKDYEDYKFNYDKVQLPYYNEVGIGNCTHNKVVTGWKITAVGVGSGDQIATEGTFTASDTWDGYNFADRTHYAKDLYSKSGRVFSQGAYFDVPDGVTSITIEPYWGKAAYLSDATYDCYGVYNKDLFGNGKGGISPNGVTDFGTRYTGGTAYSICGDNQTVYTDFTTALNALTGVNGPTVYDYAVVLVGNYHQAGPPATGTKPFTIMSVDQNDDNEPDYCLIISSGKQQGFSPVRFDFVGVPGTTMAHKITSTTFMGILGNHKWKGWLETTNTTLIRFSQLEYDSENKSGSQPVILLGGIVEQMVSTNGSDAAGTVTHTKYIHVGGNAWFKLFNNGCHMDKTKTPTPRVPISVTGGDFEKFYLSGYLQPDAPTVAGDAECYISGGRFGELAGAGQEQIDGNVTWQIDRADITDFYGGGINDKKPITGNISVTIRNSYVNQYCGGPKFGNMAEAKTVSTTATNCHFGTYFGAGYGGTSLFRFTPAKNEHNKYDQLNYPWDTWLGDGNGYSRGKYDSSKGIAVSYEYEQFEGSNDKTVGRLYVNYASLSVAQTNSVSSSLIGCTVTGNVYGGGNLGKVDGTATSTLTNCTVGGSVYGAGFSATAPKAKVFPQSGMSPNPNYNTNTGIFEEGGYPTAVEYTWSKTKGASATANSLVDDADGHWIHTDIDLTTLGAVTGKVTLNIEGTTTVAGNVYGGGESSDADGDVEVNINGGTMAQDVYGGGALGHTNTANTTNTSDNTTAVNLNGGTVNGDVYGGGLGRLASGNDPSAEGYLPAVAALVKGDVTVTLSGTKMVSGTGYGRVFGANNINGTPLGHVRVLVEKTTAVDGQAIDVAAVFGGGNMAAYEPTAANDYAEVEINETTADGHRLIVGNVFGGGNEAGIVAGTQVNIIAGQVKTGIYGGCNTSGTVSGAIAVNINGGTVGTDATHTADVYGGGYGQSTATGDNVSVTIGDGTTTPVIWGDVYGGSALGNVNDNTTEITKVWLKSGTINGSLYGGGLGRVGVEAVTDPQTNEITTPAIQAVAALVNGNVQVVVDGGTVTQVFGCNNANGTPKGTVTVTVNGTDHSTVSGNSKVYAIQGVYGGGNLAHYDPTTPGNYPTVTINDCGSSIKDVFGGGNAAAVPYTSVTINGGDIDRVFAGGNGESGTPANVGWKNTDAAPNSDNYGAGTANVLIAGGTINQVYGGSNANGTIRGANSININKSTAQGACSMIIGEVYGGGNLANGKAATITITNTGSFVSGENGHVAHPENIGKTLEGIGYVYGGAKQANIGASGDGNASNINLNITGGIIANVFGGNNQSGTIYGTITVNIEKTGNTDWYVGNVFGGGNQAAYSAPSGSLNYPVVNIKNGTVSKNVYGGGLGAGATVTGNPQVTIGDATDGYEAIVTGDVYGGGDAAAVNGTPVVKVISKDNTSIGNVYGGGNAADVYGTDVTIDGGTIGMVFGGGHGDKTTNPQKEANVNGTNNGNVSLIVTGGTINKVFGGSNSKGNITGTISVVVNKGNQSCDMHITELYGGGNEAAGNAGTLTIGCTGDYDYDLGQGEGIGDVYGGANNADVNNNITLNITGGHINRVFGGNNNGGSITGTIQVNVVWAENSTCGDNYIGSVFGGGNQAVYTAPQATPNYPAVNIQNGTVSGDVFGGGYGKENDASKGVVNGNPQVTISGSGASVSGGVFGGGSLAPTNGNPTVTLTNGTTTNIYGGGKRAEVDGNTTVKIEGGSVTTDVYGGGMQGHVTGNVTVYIGKEGTTVTPTIGRDVYGGGALANTNTTNITGKDSNNNNIYDVGEGSKKTEVYLYPGPTIVHDVYGGGRGQKAGNGEIDVEAVVCGAVTVYQHGAILTAAYNSEGLATSGRIFGGNNVNGSPKGHILVYVDKTTGTPGQQRSQSTAANATHTYELAAVYGGGNEAEYNPYEIDPNNPHEFAEVHIEGCNDVSIHSVYGGGNAASTPATKVTIGGAYEIEYVFGGGNGAGATNPGANVGYHYYDPDDLSGTGYGGTTAEAVEKRQNSNLAYGTGVATTDIYGGRIHHVYGGSNTKGNIRQTAVSMLDELNSCELIIDGIYGGGREAYMEGETKMEMGCITGMDEIYGGSENADVGNNIVLTITGGHYNKVFGGNNKGGRIFGSITVNIEQTECVPITIGELYLGGNNAPYSVYGYEDTYEVRTIGTETVKHYNLKKSGTKFKNANNEDGDPVLNIRSFESIGTVYGGGNGVYATMVGDPTVDINVTQGWVNGEYNGSKGMVNGVYNVNEDEYSDYKNQPKILSTDGVITTVYGGGNAAKVIGNTKVLIGDKFGGDPVTLKSMEDLYNSISESGETTKRVGLLDISISEVNNVKYITYTALKKQGNDLVVDSEKNPLTVSINQTVNGVTITGNVYGGGYGATADVTGSTTVQIGKEPEQNNDSENGGGENNEQPSPSQPQSTQPQNANGNTNAAVESNQSRTVAPNRR